ncbi:ribosomal RNA processing protein 1 homolog Nnp-1 isoform X2 [Arctopsyche grandis]|uniref:ribosomal RNA processing protein 1 homolog Nnp-1 isoform X2 n=1 Tax=Arctopsyche grandis TaxID=121162 RepID=UPI00406D9994
MSACAVRVIAQELSLSRGLAANDVRRRDRVLKSLSKWLSARDSSTYDFTEHDFMRIWKGLFYCVWMSDKPLVQEELCENIAKLIQCFEKFSTSILFYKCFLKTMGQNWFGIDQHRLDKFLMCVRRVTRGMFYNIKKHNWSKEATDFLQVALSEDDGLFASPTPNDARMALGLQLHLVDCWTEEISKVSEGEISSQVVTRLIKPFAIYLCRGKEARLSSAIMKNIFINLIRQTDVGIEYSEKELAWRQAGYPGGNIDAMEKVDVSDDENSDDMEEDTSNEALDPRAGYVNTVLPQMPIDGQEIAKMLRDLIPESNINCSNRTRMKDLIENFDTLSSGTYPLKMKDIELPKDPAFKLPKAAKAALDLINFEKKIGEMNDEKELIGLNKRQKRRYLAKQRKKQLYESDESEDEDKQSTTTPAKKAKMNNNISSGHWHVEDLRLNDSKADNKTDKKSSPKNGIAKAVEHVNGFDSEIIKENGHCNGSEQKLPAKKIPNGTLKTTPKKSESVMKKLVNNSNMKNSKKLAISVSSVQSSPLPTLKIKISDALTSTPNDNKKSKADKINCTNTSVKKAMKSPKETITPKINVKHIKKSLDSTIEDTEIIIPIKKIKKVENRLNKSESIRNKIKSKQTALLCSNLSVDNLTPLKRVNIALTKNTSQAVIDYFKSVKQSPEIPFDGGKKPIKTSLKPNSMPSPVNPFYKRKLQLKWD